jgi:hypothetical protein
MARGESEANAVLLVEVVGAMRPLNDGYDGHRAANSSPAADLPAVTPVTDDREHTASSE